MRFSMSLVAVMVGTATIAIASPVTPRTPLFKRDGAIGQNVAGIGQCPKDCWNEAAGEVDCNPNLDDDCACGAFFDAVTSCTAAICSAADNLGTLDFLEEGCN